MDIFKQKRNLIITVVVLVLLNIATLSTIWFSRPNHRFPGKPDFGADKKNHVQKLLKEELGFTDEQAEKYVTLQKKHRKDMSKLNEEFMEAKRNIFDYVLQNEIDEETLDSLKKVSLEKQSKLDNMTINHFKELKKICKPEQVEKLKDIMIKILPPPPGRGGKDFPPPGERPLKK